MDHSQPIILYWQSPQGRVRLGIAHAKDHSFGNDRIEVRALSPKNAALPITQNGYLSHIISAKELAKAGGPRRYVERLLTEGTKSRAWKRYLASLSQPDLFRSVGVATVPAKPLAEPDRPAKAEQERGRRCGHPSPS